MNRLGTALAMATLMSMNDGSQRLTRKPYIKPGPTKAKKAKRKAERKARRLNRR